MVYVFAYNKNLRWHADFRFWWLLADIVFLWSLAVQQLEFLEGRKKQYIKAALQAKQKNDMEQAKTLFRTAKSLEPLIQAVHSGTAVDISKVSAVTVHNSGVCKDSFVKASMYEVFGGKRKSFRLKGLVVF